MRNVLLLIVAWRLIGTALAFAGSPSAPVPLPEDSAKVIAARHAMLEILRGARVFHEDRGNWANSVELLDSLGYVTFDSTLRADWTFSFGGNPPASVRATQNYLAKNARQDGMGMPHWVVYELETGTWSGSGVRGYGQETLPLAEQAFLVAEVQASMFALANASKVSYQDRGTTSSVVQLVKSRYVTLPNSVKLNWQIRMHGAAPDSLVAISTDWMPDGPDHRLVYYPAAQKFSGYGVVDPYYVPSLTPYLEYVEPAKKAIGK